jgi:hypothetical protein
MSEPENELLDQAVDPPNNDGGTINSPKTAGALDSTSIETARSVDPPNNDGGTGK